MGKILINVVLFDAFNVAVHPVLFAFQCFQPAAENLFLNQSFDHFRRQMHFWGHRDRGLLHQCGHKAATFRHKNMKLWQKNKFGEKLYLVPCPDRLCKIGFLFCC